MPTAVGAEARAFLARGVPISSPAMRHADKERWRPYIAQIEVPLFQVSQMRVRTYPTTIVDAGCLIRRKRKPA